MSPAAAPRAIISAHTDGHLTIVVTATSTAPPPAKASVHGHVAGVSVDVDEVTATDTGFTITATVAPTVPTGAWPYGFWADSGAPEDSTNIPIAAGTVLVIPNPAEGSA